jgi:hypothetical protein
MLQIQYECKLDINVDEYVESTVRPFLMDVIYCWSKVSLFTLLLELLLACLYLSIYIISLCCHGPVTSLSLFRF